MLGSLTKSFHYVLNVVKSGQIMESLHECQHAFLLVLLISQYIESMFRTKIVKKSDAHCMLSTIFLCLTVFEITAQKVCICQKLLQHVYIPQLLYCMVR
jgi:hypothetical protein